MMHTVVFTRRGPMKTRRFYNRLEIECPAKLNLFLELPAKRDDGFHEIQTVMSTVSIFDSISFTKRDDSQINLNVCGVSPGQLPRETDPIPTDGRNLIVKAIEKIRALKSKTFPDACRTGFDILLRKNIPSAAGLGGASSNAAGALLAANRLWDLNLSQTELHHLASELGSDVPFFLTGGMAVCRGRGEIIQPINVPSGHSIVVAKPPAALSTAEVFSQVSIGDDLRSSDSLIQNVASGIVSKIGGSLFNRLQKFAEPFTTQIAQLSESFNRIGTCCGHQMSGSGSSYFGLFSNTVTARQAAECLSARHPDVRIFYCRTLSPLHC